MMLSSRGAIFLETHQLPTLQSELLTCFPSSSRNLLLYDLVEIDYDDDDKKGKKAVIHVCQTKNEDDNNKSDNKHS